MKKIKLILKFDELNALYASLFNGLSMYDEPRTPANVLLQSNLVELYMRLAPKVQFRTDKKFKITISMAHASALAIHAKANIEVPSRYMDALYLRIANTIEQQIA